MLPLKSSDRRLASVTRRAKGTPVPREYRVLRLGVHGQITASDSFPAHDDAVAIVIARAMEASTDREVWEDHRLVAKLPANTPK